MLISCPTCHIPFQNDHVFSLIHTAFIAEPIFNVVVEAAYLPAAEVS